MNQSEERKGLRRAEAYYLKSEAVECHCQSEPFDLEDTYFDDDVFEIREGNSGLGAPYSFS